MSREIFSTQPLIFTVKLHTKHKHFPYILRIVFKARKLYNYYVYLYYDKVR